ncbi:hypothetical protein Pcinc_026245 [Petrolisthes cinctipes]|uniref:C-type lectin domain-containing protein n=1 Tax=Petrolisthes cinctipes TaxID=88211 RepID=A0AAE1KCL8_PETCI|nr:hypothetical protein Pcinc_026245 [Petrolisthes cinctipes]
MSAGGVLLLPRLLVVVWGLLLPHSLLLVQVSGGEVMTWYKTQVSKGKLQTHTPTEITSNRIIECAVMASQDPGTRHLFCHPDAATCSFYDLKVEAGHDDSAIGPVQDCWTRHFNLCYSSEKIYEDGEIFVDSDSCKTFQCNAGTSTQLQDSRSSNVILLAEEECVFIEETEMTFDEARTICRTEGGDMYSGGDYESLQKHLGTKSYTEVWVGARSQAWLDGRPVTEWGPADPNGASDDCIRMRNENGVHEMMDASCSKLYPVLCHKGVSYS